MRTISLEQLAAKWTMAHTLAVTAWALALVLGVALLFRHTSADYPVSEGLKVYAGENATFTYPANWTINNCVPGKPFIEVPGTIKADYKGQQAYLLTVYGVSSYRCMKDRPERFDLYPETLIASETPCAPASSTRGERLDNGLYLQLDEEDGRVVAASIRQNSCFAPYTATVLAFAFADPKAEENEETPAGRPGVARDEFLASRQYQDIRALAASFRY